eukprot:SAG31_NODE_43890_length_265_cov_0.626506_1_plen_78_part_01
MVPQRALTVGLLTSLLRLPSGAATHLTVGRERVELDYVLVVLEEDGPCYNSGTVYKHSAPRFENMDGQGRTVEATAVH